MRQNTARRIPRFLGVSLLSTYNSYKYRVRRFMLCTAGGGGVVNAKRLPGTAAHAAPTAKLRRYTRPVEHVV